jgi:hypothetical protein
MGVRSVHEALGIYTHDVHCTDRAQGLRLSSGPGAVVGARHPRPPARHWAAERRYPSPRPLSYLIYLISYLIYLIDKLAAFSFRCAPLP